MRLLGLAFHKSTGRGEKALVQAVPATSAAAAAA
jgi:hypothetical protein